MLPFSNPRLVAEFDDWPSGAARVKCRFAVEMGGPKLGGKWRVSRATTDKHGRWCKPKFTTFSFGPNAIVDGSDGKTYILRSHPTYGGVGVTASDLVHDANLPGLSSAVAYRDSSPELYATLLALIDAAR